MLVPPGAIVIVNDDLTENVRNFLSRQLFINETIDGYVFDQRIESNPNYPRELCQLNQRLMVVRSLDELQNREYADIVIFVAHGLAALLENKFGPRGITFPVVDLTWGKFCVFG